jgi:hypothetical protein
MTFRENLHNSQEYQEVTGQAGANTPVEERAQRDVPVAGPVISLEKTDIEFWLQVLQVVLLILIYRELTGGGA